MLSNVLIESNWTIFFAFSYFLVVKRCGHFDPPPPPAAHPPARAKVAEAVTRARVKANNIEIINSLSLTQEYPETQTPKMHVCHSRYA